MANFELSWLASLVQQILELFLVNRQNESTQIPSISRWNYFPNAADYHAMRVDHLQAAHGFYLSLGSFF
jgi:hypothetical protein